MLGLRPASRCMLYTRVLQRDHARDKKREEQGTADDRRGGALSRFQIPRTGVFMLAIRNWNASVFELA